MNSQPRPTHWPQRQVVVGLTFLACTIAYTDRVNIAVAAVAMKEQFGWSQTQKGLVLASFFVGYLLFMFLSGVLATRFGGKRVLGWSVVAWSAFTLLTPFAAAVSMSALVVARIGMGIGEAAMFPATYELFGRWVPPTERARATSRMLSGIPVGTVVGLMGSGWLVAHFGWPSAFYAFGAVGIVWAVGWFRRVQNDPATDPHVQADERELLARLCPPPIDAERMSYSRLLLRAPVAGLVIAHFAATWSLYMLLSWLPSYFREVQGLSIANAGLFSAAPWLSMFAATNIAAVFADRMIKRGVGITTMRKIMQCGSLVVSAALLIAMRNPHTVTTALILLCVATASLGCTFSGFGPAVLDIAPHQSGLLYGFSNTFATIPGVVGVTITGWLVDVTGTYSAAFTLTAAISCIGALAFASLFDTRRPVA